MSEEEAATGPSRKEKRAQRDAERAASKRGKKRKAADEEVDENAVAAPETEFKDDFIALPTPVELRDGVKTEEKSSKKRKRTQEPTEAKTEADDAAKPAPKKKKRKPAASDTGATTDDTMEIKAKPANQRFIVFVGNLPYATTDAALQTHFKSLQPFTLRHRTDPATKKSKGFAFLEFENYDRMKTCLKLYHHSYFDPEDASKSKLIGADGVEPEVQVRSRGGRGPKEKGRKINVELTAGGGGGKENRMEKIRVKNVRLEEQRERRKEVERKERLNNEKKGGGKDGKDGKDGKKVEAVAEEKRASAEGMHPSRLAMMNR
jgi:nucleolar protein 6